jgi:ribonucleoside-diphosphate reductase alpha chain
MPVDQALKALREGSGSQFDPSLVQLAEAEPVRAEWEQRFLANLQAGAIGAGRIMSAAGTSLEATLINCFVQPVGDCIQGVDDEGFPGIYEALRE